MNKWIEEALQAPRDARALLLGLVAACSVFALLRHEFATEPLRVLLASWSYWSHAFWQACADLLRLKLYQGQSGLLTLTVMTWIVFLRGHIRGQSLTPVRSWWDWLGLFVVGVALGFGLLLVVVAMAVWEKVPAGYEAPPLIRGLMMFCILLALPMGLVAAIVKTPRSFFGVVIAAIAILLIDKRPLLPTATNSGG